VRIDVLGVCMSDDNNNSTTATTTTTTGVQNGGNRLETYPLGMKPDALSYSSSTRRWESFAQNTGRFGDGDGRWRCWSGDDEVG
jgi:hypothetical protein